MREPVLLKGNSYGLTIILDDSIQFDALLKAIEEKFCAAAGFFNSDKQVALKVEGRKLSSDELSKVLQVIQKTSSLAIAYVMEDDKVLETKFKHLLEQSFQDTIEREQEQEQAQAPKAKEDSGKFYKGTLRSGQNLESDSSVVVIGDVNPGATVNAKGNIVVLGCIKGNVCAGGDDNNEAFIAALDMNPIQIRIGSKIARSSDNKDTKKKRFRRKKKENYNDEAKIAFVEDGNIYIEPISKALLNEILI